MANKIPPVPIGSAPGSAFWNDWYEKLRNLINSGTISQLWSSLDFTASNITDIVTRNHNNLQGFQGGTTGEYYHLTQAQHTALSSSISVSTVTTNTTLTDANGTVLVDTTAGNVTITLPNATTNTGKSFIMKRITAGGNTLTIATGGGTIDGSATVSMPLQYESLTMQSDGTNYWIT